MKILLNRLFLGSLLLTLIVPSTALAAALPDTCAMEVTFDVTPKKISTPSQNITLKATVKDATGKDCSKSKVEYVPTFYYQTWNFPYNKPIPRRGINDSNVYNKQLSKTFKASDLGIAADSVADVRFVVTFPDYGESSVQAAPVSVTVGTPKTSTDGRDTATKDQGLSTGDSGVGLDNPLEATSLIDLFLKFINTMLMLLGSAAVLFIIIGGFKMTASGGKQETIDSGKRTVTWAVFGLVVALMSWSIVIIVQNLLKVK